MVRYVFPARTGDPVGVIQVWTVTNRLGSLEIYRTRICNNGLLPSLFARRLLGRQFPYGLMLLEG